MLVKTHHHHHLCSKKFPFAGYTDLLLTSVDLSPLVRVVKVSPVSAAAASVRPLQEKRMRLIFT